MNWPPGVPGPTRAISAFSSSVSISASLYGRSRSSASVVGDPRRLRSSLRLALHIPEMSIAAPAVGQWSVLEGDYPFSLAVVVIAVEGREYRQISNHKVRKVPHRLKLLRLSHARVVSSDELLRHWVIVASTVA